jgi:hypothetical protein
MVRKFIAVVLAFGLSTPAFAGGIRESAQQAVQRAAQQQAQAQSQTQPATGRRVRNGYLWPGAIVFIAGMAMASYGFLHTTDGDYVEPSDASKLSNTKLGISGLALAASGGAVMLLGARQRVGSLPNAQADASIGIGKRITW